MKGTARGWHDDPRATSKGSVSELRFAIDHEMEKVEIGRHPRGSRPSGRANLVYCVGEGTAFRLSSRAGDRPFTVQGIGKTPRDASAYLGTCGRFVKAHRGVAGTTFGEFLATPGFAILNAKTIEEGLARRLEVECATGAGRGRRHVVFRLDPDNEFLVTSCREFWEGFPGLSVETRVEYRRDPTGRLVPSLVVIRDRTGVTEHREFTNWEFAGTPRGEFDLPFYGLPDLIHRSSGRNWTHYGLAGAAVLLAAAGFFVRWRLAARR